MRIYSRSMFLERTTAGLACACEFIDKE